MPGNIVGLGNGVRQHTAVMGGLQRGGHLHTGVQIRVNNQNISHWYSPLVIGQRRWNDKAAGQIAFTYIDE